MGIVFSLLAALFFSLSHITVRKGVTKLGVSSGTLIMLLAGNRFNPADRAASLKAWKFSARLTFPV